MELGVANTLSSASLCTTDEPHEPQDTMSSFGGNRWGDDEEDDAFLPTPQETPVSFAATPPRPT